MGDLAGRSLAVRLNSCPGSRDSCLHPYTLQYKVQFTVPLPSAINSTLSCVMSSSGKIQISRLRQVQRYMNPPTSVTIPTQFPLFPQLPIEIRRTIWFHALPGPRVLQLDRARHRRDRTSPVRPLHSVRSLPQNLYTITAASYGGHYPNILSVNRESRLEALYFLTPIMASTGILTETLHISRTRMWMMIMFDG